MQSNSTIIRSKPIRLMAVASSGGHWIQLLRLRPAFEGCEVIYVTTQQNPREDLSGAVLENIPDANRWQKWKLVVLMFRVLVLLVRHRPHVIISTGAAPGCLAIGFGKLLGARTLWIDSIANAEKMSLSGKLVKRWATHTLSQWPDVAKAEGVAYEGAVL